MPRAGTGTRMEFGCKALGVSHVLMEPSYRETDRMIRTFETFAREIRPRV